ncbi:MAG: OmpA family protein, partial [Candidatus Kapaibacteriota bacterium]
AMKDLLVQAGIDEERIIPIGKGETEPIVSNSTPEGRRRNRRVEYTFFSCPQDSFEENNVWEEEF